MKLEKMALAHAAALSSALLWTLCSLSVVLLPSFVETLRQAIMHGAPTAGTLEVTFGSYLLGGLAIVIVSWIWGYVFGWAWELVSKK